MLRSRADKKLADKNCSSDIKMKYRPPKISQILSTYKGQLLSVVCHPPGAWVSGTFSASFQKFVFSHFTRSNVRNPHYTPVIVLHTGWQLYESQGRVVTARTFRSRLSSDGRSWLRDGRT